MEPKEKHSPSRREFLASTATMAMAANSLTKAESAGSTFCVDCQSHLFVPEMVEFMKGRKDPPFAYEKGGDTYVVVGEWHRRLRTNHMDPGEKIAAMDAAGIDITTVSINDPGPELFGRDGIKVARMAHERLADVSQQYPGRFAPLAVLPLQDMDGALNELQRCMAELGFKGVLLYSNLNGQFPDEPRFRRLFAYAEEQQIPLLLHPAYPMTYEATKGHQLTGGLGLMFDTTIALARIILAGILEDHPRLKLLCPHVGGALPYLIGRLDHQTQVLKRGTEHIKKAPSEYLRQIYFDTVSPLPMAIQYGYDFLGPDRLLYASDHPWVDPQLIVSHIKSLNLGAEVEKKIFGENARRFFDL